VFRLCSGIENTQNGSSPINNVPQAGAAARQGRDQNEMAAHRQGTTLLFFA